MKKLNVFKMVLGLGLLLASITVDLGSSTGLNNSSADESAPGKFTEITGTQKCPDGTEVFGTVCISGGDPCTPTVKCS